MRWEFDARRRDRRRFVIMVIVFAIALLVLRTSLSNEPTPQLTTRAIVTEVYDGDTITVEVRTVLRVRLLDCWAPEIRGDVIEKQYGHASRDYLRSLLPVGTEITLQVPIGDRLDDSFTFGRVLGHVWCGADRVSDLMVRDGYAQREKTTFRPDLYRLNPRPPLVPIPEPIGN
jgi:endonuclease YncB( thermonuclease family)